LVDNSSNSISRTEWNAAVYHQVSNPHVVWGEKVITDLALTGNETVVDAGCGTGRVTEMLLEQLPEGKVIAVDRSQNMIDQGELEIGSRYTGRARFLQSDLLELTPKDVGDPVDLVFSTATFHWIKDHDLLFQRLFALLKPGGRLVAQCGGGPNLDRLVKRADALIAAPSYAEYFADFDQPKFYVDADLTGPRLEQAGFVDVETHLISAPALLPDADTFAQFVTNVVYREHLTALPDQDLRGKFVEQLTAAASKDNPPFELDYWRLNLSGTRPI
jgi:trans-aconitate 2-methyltransferase